jgi:hypothetical protein
MTTNYLRFTDESTFRSAAFIAGFCSEPVRARNEDGTFTADDPGTPVDEAWEPFQLMAYTHDHAIDVVGTIWNNDGVFDSDGTVVTPATAKAGYHVNYVGVLPEGWSEFLVAPAAPYRVFA